MTRDVPQALQVILSDERSAGRVAVDWHAFVRLSEYLDRQVLLLEAQIRRAMPQLAQRGASARRGSRKEWS
ncbi:MAG: hypothetical protein SFU86_18885 [Pirellulaceae bacterium]|nr:hypothetical protein [Pirellulaceae bacterium]